ncbi:hypothetical protein HYFRA_00009932 [Hymenoscyphus fraxineus]|uniref:C2H2-type domain-containing protein n=1 Tax=Hymenoscyphus fraxineus TaxID=746836 RepID=A0A9N9L1R9_9HELO|nr:hypothetical protein HYFRA_00009932 [Hymenoscyphus fraxineus]
MSSLAPWGFPERIVFFAWWDFCVENDIPATNESFCETLEEIAGMKVGKTQINNRLHSLERQKRNLANPRLSGTELREKGPQCLEIPAGEQLLLKELSLMFKDIYLTVTNDSTVRHTAKEPIPSRAAALSNARVWFREKIQQPYSENAENEGSEIGRKRKCSGKDSKTTQESKSDDYPVHQNHILKAVRSFSAEPSRCGERSQKRLKVSLGDNPRKVQADGKQVQELAMQDEQTPLLGRLKMEIKQFKLDIGEMRQQWDRDSWNALEREETLKQTVQTLRSENINLRMAKQESRQDGKSPLEDVLYHKNEEIWKLSKRAKDMEKLSPFSRSRETPLLPSFWKEVTSTMRVLSSELDLLLPGQGQHTSLLVPDMGDLPELAKLIRCVAANETEVGMETSVLRFWVAKHDPEVILRSLIVAAVRNWVFMSKFPVFTPKDAVLLKAYREIIRTHGNLDRAANHKLLTSVHFRSSIIPRRSDELASRLSRVLAPLFVPVHVEPTNDSLGDWGQESGIAKNRLLKFRRIFDAVLNLKARSLLSNDRYDFSVSVPGTHATVDKKIDDFWLLATVQAYPNDENRSGNEILDALLNSDAWFRQTPHEVEPKDRVQILIPMRSIPKEKLATPQIENHLVDEQAKQPRSKPICPKCRKEFASLAELLSHVENRLCGKCGQCDKAFRDLQQHALNEHDKVLQLPIDPAFNKPNATAKGDPRKKENSNSTENHEVSEESEESEESDDSGDSEELDDSDQSYRKVAHPKTFKQSDATTFPCNLCRQQFMTYRGLRMHQNRSTCGTMRKCPHCGQHMANIALSEHISKEHPESLTMNVQDSSLHSSNDLQESGAEIEKHIEESPVDSAAKGTDVIRSRSSFKGKILGYERELLSIRVDNG